MNEGTCSNASTTEVTLADVQQVVDRLKKLDTLPCRKFMTDRGFDPDKGGRMALPESWRAYFAPWGPPSYVKITKLITEPVLFHDIAWEMR